MTTSDPRPSGQRTAGRPRDPLIAEAILVATLELLAKNGFDGTSLDAVAQRAGVGKPTLYRRWSSKQDLVIAAIERLADQAEMPERGSPRERLTAFMEEWWNLTAHPELLSVTRVLASLLGDVQRHPELGEAVHQSFLRNRRNLMHELLLDAIDAGELRRDLDLDIVVDLLFSPLLVRRLVTGGPVTPDVARGIVNLVFDGGIAHPVKTTAETRS